MAENTTTNTGAEGLAGTTVNTETGEVKTYTHDEVMSMLQSESDKRVTEALKKAEKKNMLANMGDKERYEFELGERERTIAAKEKDLLLATNKVNGVKSLADCSLPSQLIDLVVNEDEEVMGMNIKLMDKYFKEAVKDGVKKALANGSPKGSNANTFVASNGMTKEAFRKLNLNEQNKIYRENPDLYRELI